jgi:hypothetical protein
VAPPIRQRFERSVRRAALPITQLQASLAKAAQGDLVEVSRAAEQRQPIHGAAGSGLLMPETA